MWTPSTQCRNVPTTIGVDRQTHTESRVIPLAVSDVGLNKFHNTKTKTKTADLKTENKTKTIGLKTKTEDRSRKLLTYHAN